MAVSFTAVDIRPLPGAVFENPVVSGTVYVGWAVYNNGGSATGANGGATATAYAYGIVVGCPGGGTVATTGDRVDVVVFGCARDGGAAPSKRRASAPSNVCSMTI